MSENTAPAQCTQEEWDMARDAGLPIFTTADEVAISKFAMALRMRDPMRRLGMYVTDFARKGGWPNDGGEGAFEFIQRISYRQGIDDARAGRDTGDGDGA